MLKVFILVTLLVAYSNSQQVPNACFCVPQGSCQTNNNNGNNNNNNNNNGNNNGNNVPNPDGSGSFDIRSGANVSRPASRIQNTGQNANLGASGTSLVLTTPATSGIPFVLANVQSCQAGLERCCPTNGYQCGMQFPQMPNSRSPVPGSSQSYYGEYPWVAAIVTPQSFFVGAGALIDHLHVLTAAHKVVQNASQGVQSNYLVELGEWDGASNVEPIPMQVIQVIRIFVHPQYNDKNLRNDVALLRLAQSASLGTTPTVIPGCLPSSQIPMNGLRCHVAGWGQNSFTGQMNAVQMEVDVPLVDPFQCQLWLRQTRLGTGFTLDTTSFFCAGGETGKDSCTGDGGSPLVCNIANQWYVIGLVAWGVGCGGFQVPGAYVNVASYVSWIQQSTRS